MGSGVKINPARFYKYFVPPILPNGTPLMIIHQRVEGGVLMGVRNVRRLELRRLEAKTLDARFLTEIQQGLNCSPFEGEAVLKVVTVLVSHVVSKDVERQLRLPGELRAYQDVAIYPKVQGFVETLNVDRGSAVKRGQVLTRMSVPELASRTAEAQA